LGRRKNAPNSSRGVIGCRQYPLSVGAEHSAPNRAGMTRQNRLAIAVLSISQSRWLSR
jgi:hypothetical protein